jgi:hypothetical protein
MKKCRHCKEPFTPIRSTLEKYCQKSECIRVWVETEKQKAWTKKKKQAKAEMLTVQDYVKMAQQVFNAYINKRDSGKPCISCGKKITGRVNASHYYNANNHWNVRFDEMNVHGACVECNQWKHGNLIEYGIRLEKLIGEDEFTILRDKAYQLRKFTREELKEIIAYYKAKIRGYENNR